MAAIEIRSVGRGACAVRHTASGREIETDLPAELGGAGTSFSATDLLAAALGVCIATNVDAVAERHGVPLESLSIGVDKTLAADPKRLVALDVRVRCSVALRPDIRVRLERAADQCLVHRSLHPDVTVSVAIEAAAVPDVSIRKADLADLDAVQRVRGLVRENRLSSPLPLDRVVAAFEARGRCWVAEHDGEVVGFTMADRLESMIWALFLLPEWEGKGIGRALLDRAVAWLWEQGATEIWLTTDPATRAAGFYERVGWRRAGPTPHGEVRFELRRESPRR